MILTKNYFCMLNFKKIVMKKLTTTITAATVAILLLFTGCDKYHRDRYIGNWDFVTEMRFCNFDGSGNFIVEKRDTIYYTGTISLGNLEHELIIQYTENDKIIASIDDKGTSLWTNYDPGPSTPSGYFENKNIIRLFLRYPDEYYDQIVHNVYCTKKKGGK